MPESQFGKYWLIAIPEGSDVAASVAALNKDTMKAGYSSNFPFPIPDLRTGTLDQLMAVSEKLEKLDLMTKTVAGRTYKGAQEAHMRQKPDAALIEIPLLIGNGNRQEQVGASQYVENFRWNQARYPSEQKSLERVAAEIEKEIMQIDEKAKNYIAKYTEMKNTLENLNKDQKGSLAIQPIDKYFKPDTLVDTPSLANLILAVKNANIKSFVENYSSLDEGKLVKRGQDEKALRMLKTAIVPDSYTELAVDKEYTLCSIVVMKKFADVVSSIMQKERHVVRPFRYEKDSVKKSRRRPHLRHRSASQPQPVWTSTAATSRKRTRRRPATFLSPASPRGPLSLRRTLRQAARPAAAPKRKSISRPRWTSTSTSTRTRPRAPTRTMWRNSYSQYSKPSAAICPSASTVNVDVDGAARCNTLASSSCRSAAAASPRLLTAERPGSG